MREKSQLEDMRAAVRGDLERARARREADPWRPQEPETAAEEPASSEAPEPDIGPRGPTPEASVPAETTEQEPTPAPDPTPNPEPNEREDAAEEPPEPPAAPPATEPVAQDTAGSAPQEKGFFARLFGR